MFFEYYSKNMGSIGVSIVYKYSNRPTIFESLTVLFAAPAVR